MPRESERTRDRLRVRIGSHLLRAHLEVSMAPNSCAAFVAKLPLKLSPIHAPWSGEWGWAPLGDTRLRIAPENATSYPRPGQVLVYAGEISEPEILVPYGAAFASKAGPLAGNHVMTITDQGELLQQIGEALLWRGALPIMFEREP
jgi:hypothetical protein